MKSFAKTTSLLLALAIAAPLAFTACDKTLSEKTKTTTDGQGNAKVEKQKTTESPSGDVTVTKEKKTENPQ